MTMLKFLELTDEQRKAVCTATGDSLSLHEVAVEKDFWVCWILKKLFTIPEWGAHLTFKGGTSLSKGWGLIERFSEDIDIVIYRGHLGFGGEDAPENAPSGKQKKKRSKALTKACQECVSEKIAPALSHAIGQEIPATFNWELKLDPDDSDAQTLLFDYPSVYGEESLYLRRAVKIEMGARSDVDPAESIMISPYINKSYPDLFTDSFEVRAVAPERTFWEKTMLLHEENCREQKARRFLARHYYDIYCLMQAGIAEKAARDLDLFQRILEHRMFYFKHNWMDYGTIAPGTLRILPLQEHMADWESDYRDMVKEMFYGTAPSFDEIIVAIKDFQDRFNT
ncbi:nucleotidyl transferase AbiEii/AbiGii toxin family protein [Desulforhopalus sp. 52FAK]